MITRDQIAEQRKKFVESGYRTGSFDVDDNLRRGPIAYFILPQALENSLPGFAFQMVADGFTDEEVGHDLGAIALFGVSDGVPERHRKYVVLHEYIEYVQKRPCMTAALGELQALWTDCAAHGFLREHLELRVALFEPLIPFAQKHEYAAEKIGHFQNSLDLFRFMLATMR